MLSCEKARHGVRHAICEHLQRLERTHCDFDLTNETVPIELDVIDTFDRMMQLRPSAAAYARVAYARELQGNIRGAIESMKLAAGSCRAIRDSTSIRNESSPPQASSRKASRAASSRSSAE